MADPVIVLLIVVAGASPNRPHAAVVGAGVREALGADARVLFEERDVEPTDEAARSLGAEVNVSAVAEMKWLDRDRSRANVRVYVSADDAFFNREIEFRKTDAPEEREKAVGLLVGAMVRAATSNGAPAPVATELDVTDATPVPAAATPSAPPMAPPAPPAADNPPRSSAAAPPPSRTRWRSVDVSATSALAIGGEGSGIGPSVGVQAFLVRFLAVRASAAARLGTIDQVDAASAAYRFGIGPAFRVLGTEPNDRLAVQFALEALAVDQVATRSSPPARRDRWLPGSYATVQVGYRMSPVFEPYVGIGMETVFGSTPIVLDGKAEAVLPRVRMTADAGARVHF